MAVHSDGERIEVRRNAPGTWGTSCRDAASVGGVQDSGESDVDGERGIAFAQDEYTIAGWRLGGRRSGPGVLEHIRNSARIWSLLDGSNMNISYGTMLT